MAALFDLLGISSAKEGSKAVQFDVSLKTLGLQIDLQQFGQDEVFVGHTESRRSELENMIGDILKAGSVISKQAESLRGRLHWFESFSFGRFGNRYIKLLGGLAYKESKIILMQPEIKALTFLKERVFVAPPIKLTSSSLECWIIFTDGAVEGDEGKVGSVGGVLCSPSGQCRSFFGAEVATNIMSRLCKSSANHL